MNRRAIVRGIQLIVVITIATFTWVAWRDLRSNREAVEHVLEHMHPIWLVVAAVCALQEGVCGGLRIFVLGRVLSNELKVRTAVISEFVLMFCAGVTPGQVGAPPSQVAVLVNGGMKLVDVATAELLVASCTILFFLATALAIVVMRATGLLVVDMPAVDHLLYLSVAIFGTGLVALILCATYPPLLKTSLRGLGYLFGPIWRGLLHLVRLVPRVREWADGRLARRGSIQARLIDSVDEFHEGFRVYARRGKLAYAGALLLTFAFFCSRFAVAYFILRALGIDTTPSSFVSIGPPIAQVVLVQALLNFALYLAPTPGGSGIAEFASRELMRPWVKGPFIVPYLVLWRLLALFLCMFVGGVYVFRYLGTDVLEARVKENAAAKKALEAERLATKESTA